MSATATKTPAVRRRKPVVPRADPRLADIHRATEDGLRSHIRAERLHDALVESICAQLALGLALVFGWLGSVTELPGSVALWLSALGCAAVWVRDVQRWRRYAVEAGNIERVRRVTAGLPERAIHPALTRLT